MAGRRAICNSLARRPPRAGVQVERTQTTGDRKSEFTWSELANNWPVRVPLEVVEFSSPRQRHGTKVDWPATHSRASCPLTWAFSVTAIAVIQLAARPRREPCKWSVLQRAGRFGRLSACQLIQFILAHSIRRRRHTRLWSTCARGSQHAGAISRSRIKMRSAARHLARGKQALTSGANKGTESPVAAAAARSTMRLLIFALFALEFTAPHSNIDPPTPVPAQRFPIQFGSAGPSDANPNWPRASWPPTKFVAPAGREPLS